LEQQEEEEETKNEEKSYMYCRERDDRCFNAHKKRLLYCFARAQIVLLLEGKISLYVYIYIYICIEMRDAHKGTYL
jgi:hypothetical protein